MMDHRERSQKKLAERYRHLCKDRVVYEAKWVYTPVVTKLANMEKTFRIDYIDSKSQEIVTKMVKFEDTINPNITAKEWAEDAAYSWADKGWYEVTEIRR